MALSTINPDLGSRKRAADDEPITLENYERKLVNPPKKPQKSSKEEAYKAYKAHRLALLIGRQQRQLRLRLILSQRERLLQCVALARALWGWLIELNEAHKHEFGRFMTTNEMQARLPALKEEQPELDELPAATVQATADALVDAYIALTTSGNRALDPALNDKHREFSLYVPLYRINAERQWITVANLGGVGYAISAEKDDLLAVLRESGSAIKLGQGARLWSNRGVLWYAEIGFTVTDKAAVKNRISEARLGKLTGETPEKEDRALSLLDVAMKVMLDQHLGFKGIRAVQMQAEYSRLIKAGHPLHLPHDREIAARIADLCERAGLPPMKTRDVVRKGIRIPREYPSKEIWTLWEFFKARGRRNPWYEI
jgi:hypothetical protein